MIIVQYVRTTNDRNGNPRRGWQVWDVDTDALSPTTGTGLAIVPDYLGYVDEGYVGHRAFSDQLRVAYGDELPLTAVMPPVNIGAGDHRTIRNGAWFVDYAEARSTARHQATHNA